MKKNYRLLHVIFLIFIQGPCLHVFSQVHQPLSVGSPVIEDYYRRLQLMGQIDSTLSFSIRPLTNAALLRDNLLDPDDDLANSRAMLLEKGVQLSLLPLNWQSLYTSNLPSGWNDGALIPSVGYQTLFSAGIHLDYKFLSIQLQPEFVFSQNKAYRGFEGSTTESWQLWYEWGNNIDMPERFGEGNYTRLLPGQSSVRVNFDPISFGVSSENIWWGPGIRNSLLMSNTAPGFFHLTLNSTRPIRSGIGSFEGQIIAGRLRNSGFSPTPLGNPNHYDEYYVPKPDDWRYLSGAYFTYQPKWLPGLFLGMGQSFVVYEKDMGHKLNDYLPFLGPGNSSPEGNPAGVQSSEQKRHRDRYSSFSIRWVMPRGKAEFYAELGRNVPAWNIRDELVEPEHSLAYVLGFNKLVPLKNTHNDQLQIGFELTQVDRNRTYSIRESPSWYTSETVRHGYTNLGQVLGAGIGPGASLQSVRISWNRGLKSIGLQMERQEHQNDFYYDAVAYAKDYRRNWIDLSAALLGAWDYKNLVFNARMQFISVLNYEYQIQNGPSFWDFTSYDKFNFQAQLGIQYRF